MKKVTVRRPKPQIRRNDPQNVALMNELKRRSDAEIRQIEAAIQDYLQTGNLAPELGRLMSIVKDRITEAA